MKMWKRLFAMILTLAMALSLSACGSFEARVARAAKKLQSTKSMHMDMSVSFDIALSMLGQELGIDFDMDVESDMFMDPLQAKMIMTMNSMGESSSILSYAEKNDESYTLYVSADDGTTWQKRSVDVSELPAQLNASNAMDQLSLFIESAQSFQEVGTEQINGSDAVRYDGTLKGEAVAKAMELSGILDTFSSQFGGELDLSAFDDSSIPASIWIDTKSGYIVRYDLDMTEIMGQVLKTMLSSTMESAGLADMSELVNGVELNNCLASVVLSQFNAVEPFQIPEEAREA